MIRVEAGVRTRRVSSDKRSFRIVMKYDVGAELRTIQITAVAERADLKLEN